MPTPDTCIAKAQALGPATYRSCSEQTVIFTGAKPVFIWPSVKDGLHNFTGCSDRVIEDDKVTYYFSSFRT